MRKDEGFTEELRKISAALNQMLEGDFKAAACCEEPFDAGDTEYLLELHKCSGTKYRRLIELMEEDDSEYYFSVDNDITGDIDNMKEFLAQMFRSGCDIGWGGIRADSPRGFISNLVAVDKLVSHNLVRPALWKAGAGISVPGQIFCIKAAAFRGKLIDLDTFLDDLALGLYVSIHGCKRHVVWDILGYERPNDTFSGLWRQRKRWAMGYASILKGTFGQRECRWKVIVHGLGYHCAWIVNWMIAGMLLGKGILWALLYLLLTSALIAGKDYRLLGYAFVYQIVFPVFHLRWGYALIGSLSGKAEKG